MIMMENALSWWISCWRMSSNAPSFCSLSQQYLGFVHKLKTIDGHLRCSDCVSQRAHSDTAHGNTTWIWDQLISGTLGGVTAQKISWLKHVGTRSSQSSDQMWVVHETCWIYFYSSKSSNQQDHPKNIQKLHICKDPILIPGFDGCIPSYLALMQPPWQFMGWRYVPWPSGLRRYSSRPPCGPRLDSTKRWDNLTTVAR